MRIYTNIYAIIYISFCFVVFLQLYYSNIKSIMLEIVLNLYFPSTTFIYTKHFDLYLVIHIIIKAIFRIKIKDMFINMNIYIQNFISIYFQTYNKLNKLFFMFHLTYK